MLVVPSEGVIFTVAMRNTMGVVSANVSPVRTGVRCACLAHGNNQREGRKE
jgi:hypothetical protein